jgi:TonB family protein
MIRHLPLRAINSPAHAFAFALVAPVLALAMDGNCTGGDATGCEKACSNGEATACALLGSMYRDGVGVERDVDRAAVLYEKACHGGSATGCRWLGAAYAIGRGVKKDQARAVALFKQACDGGNAGGCVSLADAYARAAGVDKSESMAAALYRQACDFGDAVGCTALKALCGRLQLSPCAPSPSPTATPPDYDEPPRLIKIVKPLYPQEAFSKKIEGTVELEILIDVTGAVARARLVKSIPLLDQAALETVYQWRFSPAMKNGRPVATIARAPVMFRIYSEPTPTPPPEP